MNDLEGRLKDLLDHESTDAPRVLVPPPGLRRRVRRRQAMTATIAAATAAVVVLAGFLGIGAILRSAPDEVPAVDPWAGYEIYERTAVISNVRIGSPSDLYLTRTVAPACIAELTCDAEQVPLIQLTTYDPGLANPVCGSAIPADGAALVLSRDFSTPPHQPRAKWPIRVDPDHPVVDGPCGLGRYVSFVDPDVGTQWTAWIAAGPGASDDGVRQMITSLEGLEFVEGELVGDRRHPAYVIAGGENAAGPWRLELRGQEAPGYIANAQLELTTSLGPPQQAGGPFVVSAEDPIDQAGGNPVFGAVTTQADGVELRLEEGTPPIPATVVPLPPSMPYDFDLFFASNDADMPATAVVIGVDPEVATPSEVADGSSEAIAEGETLGEAWTLRYDRTPGPYQVVLLDAQGSVLARLGPTAIRELLTSGLEYSTFTFSQGDQRVAIVFGAVAPAASELGIALDTGATGALRLGDPRWDPLPILTSTGQPALRLWWFETVTGHGQLATFSDSCDQLARARLITDTPSPSLPSPPPSAEPICGDVAFEGSGSH